MGKLEGQLQTGISDDAVGGGAGGGGGGLLCSCAAAIGRAVTARCVFVLLLGACVVLSAIFWLPPFHSRGSTFVPDDADGFCAEVQASFILPKPMPLLAVHAERLEYDIFGEIGLPNTKVSIISMRPWASENSTCVVFGVLPDPKYASISSLGLSVLKSSFVDLVLQHLNLSLTPSIFGCPSSFEVLRFPGGITVAPVQSGSIFERAQVLFDFKLNNSITQIQKNLVELKDQLKFGLNLKPYEIVYVKLKNTNGSTVAPPVLVEASVMSYVGSPSLLPDRLKQLAEVITGSHSKNLGLNHSVFGKVKQVELSAYLRYSIASLDPPSPSPSPSPAPSAAPQLAPSSTHSSAPSTDHCHQPRCLYCGAFSPSGSPQPHELFSANGPQPPAQSSNSHEPQINNIAPPPKDNPYRSVAHPPDLSPASNSDPHISSPSSAPTNEPLGPISKMAPELSPVSPASSYSPSPQQDKRSDELAMSPVSNLSPMPPPSSHVAPRLLAEIWLIGLPGLLTFHHLWMHY